MESVPIPKIEIILPIIRSDVHENYAIKKGGAIIVQDFP